MQKDGKIKIVRRKTQKEGKIFIGENLLISKKDKKAGFEKT